MCVCERVCVCVRVFAADRNLYIYNLQNPVQPLKMIQSQLKWQTRCVSCFPDKQVRALLS